MKITFKGNPIHTNGSLPPIGSKAPEFVLTSQDLKDCALKDFVKRRKLLSIVPSLDTSVCSLSTKKFNEAMKEHPEHIALIVSADSPFAQKRVCSVEQMENVITLSMMRSKDFAKAYGVLITDGPLAGICARAVLVLDEQDLVIYEELVPEITQEPNYEKALAALFGKKS
jgi:thiol peroxidase